MKHGTIISRLTRAGLILICVFFCCTQPSQGSNRTKNKKTVKFGVIADVHDDTTRIRAFINQTQKEKPDFIIQLKTY